MRPAQHQIPDDQRIGGGRMAGIALHAPRWQRPDGAAVHHHGVLGGQRQRQRALCRLGQQPGTHGLARCKRGLREIGQFIEEEDRRACGVGARNRVQAAAPGLDCGRRDAIDADQLAAHHRQRADADIADALPAGDSQQLGVGIVRHIDSQLRRGHKGDGTIRAVAGAGIDPELGRQRILAGAPADGDQHAAVRIIGETGVGSRMPHFAHHQPVGGFGNHPTIQRLWRAGECSGPWGLAPGQRHCAQREHILGELQAHAIGAPVAEADLGDAHDDIGKPLAGAADPDQIAGAEIGALPVDHDLAGHERR